MIHFYLYVQNGGRLAMVVSCQMAVAVKQRLWPNDKGAEWQWLLLVVPMFHLYDSPCYFGGPPYKHSSAAVHYNFIKSNFHHGEYNQIGKKAPFVNYGIRGFAKRNEAFVLNWTWVLSTHPTLISTICLFVLRKTYFENWTGMEDIFQTRKSSLSWSIRF